MPDNSHAANAKARASQQYKAGRLTKSELAHIHRMVAHINRMVDEVLKG